MILISNEERLLRRIGEHEHGLCIEFLSPTEKVSAEILRDMGLARFDVALCLTDKGKRVLAATRQANPDALKGL